MSSGSLNLPQAIPSSRQVCFGGPWGRKPSPAVRRSAPQRARVTTSTVRSRRKRWEGDRYISADSALLAITLASAEATEPIGMAGWQTNPATSLVLADPAGGIVFGCPVRLTSADS
jgi:hypothetical protein